MTDRCDTGLKYTWDCTSSLFLSFSLPSNIVIDTTLSLRHNVVVGNETIEMFGNAKIQTVRKGNGSGGGSSTEGSGRVEIHHYCNSAGCSDPDGCVTIECQQGLIN